jgi:hypothetical protein
MSPEVHQDLQRLLSALCDGELAEVDHARLQQLLGGGGDCRRMYLEYLDMHARLLVHPNLGAGQVAGGKEATDRRVRPALAPVRRRRQVLGYALVVTATLAASLLVQVLWWHPQPSQQQTARGPVDSSARDKGHVATLAQSADCVWDHPHERPRVGARLSPGELRLTQGVARIHFDGGTDLVVQGPVKLRLESASAATVMQGKVVFRADETAVPFDLHTPCSTVVDLGAEYAVAVGEGSEEIHVFDGEVRRTPKMAGDGAEPERLTAGDARSYGPSPQTPGRPTPYNPTQFVRQLANRDDLSPDQAADLLVYEGFDYSSADLLRTGKANGGFGWTSPWTPGFARPLREGDKNYLALNVKESLVRRDAQTKSIGGAFEYAGFAKYHRRMGAPLRMDADAVYYLSFLVRREGPPEEPLNAVAILFRTTEELQRGQEDGRKRLNVGVGGWNQLFTHLGGVGSRTPVPLRFGETYLLVAKIVTSKTGSDQVFMRVYSPEEPVEREESGGWTVTGPPFQSDLTFDWMEVHINSKTRQTIDEIRLGTTWSSVTAPWLGALK